jgi:hypothetical protein
VLANERVLFGLVTMRLSRADDSTTESMLVIAHLGAVADCQGDANDCQGATVGCPSAAVDRSGASSDCQGAATDCRVPSSAVKVPPLTSWCRHR